MVFWNMTLYVLIYKTTRRHIPEDRNIHINYLDTSPHPWQSRGGTTPVFLNNMD